jgi:hypothetical protein
VGLQGAPQTDNHENLTASKVEVRRMSLAELRAAALRRKQQGGAP